MSRNRRHSNSIETPHVLTKSGQEKSRYPATVWKACRLLSRMVFFIVLGIYFSDCPQEPPDPPTPMDCFDFSVTISPGECVPIDDKIADACPDSDWDPYLTTFGTGRFRLLDHEDEFYTADVYGGGPFYKYFCARTSVGSYPDEPEPVGYQTQVDKEEGQVKITYIGQANIRVTTDPSKICTTNVEPTWIYQMCISASAEPPDISVGESTQLSVQVSGVYEPTCEWTSDPQDSGLPSGPHPCDGFDGVSTAFETLTVTPTETTKYRITVQDGSDPTEEVSDTVTVTVTGNPNVAPIANAGPDQDVQTGTLVQLDGSGSNDPDNGPVSPLIFEWRFDLVPGGTALTNADIVGADTAVASFTPDVDGMYALSLIVNDGNLLGQDQVIIIASNIPPIADAGPDQDVRTGRVVQLDGSNSNDPDNGPVSPLIFEWRFDLVPGGTALTNADIVGADTAVASFTPDVDGMYALSLIVNDGNLLGQDQVIIIASNIPPIADAGPDQALLVDSTVQLDGSGSSDVDGDTLTYSWTLVSVPPGSSTTLSDSTVFNPSFVANALGTYVVELIVNDGTVDSAADTVTIITGNAFADLAVTKIDDPDPIIVDNPLTYTIKVRNNGPEDALDVMVTDTLPILPSGATVTLTSASTDQGTCNETNGVVNCALGTIPAGSNVEVIIEVLPKEATVPNPSPLSNQANVTIQNSGTVDPDPTNDTATAKTIVLPAKGSDLAVTIVDDPDPVTVNIVLTYAIEVTNYGPDDASNVNVRDILPLLPSGTSVSFISASASPGTCSEAGGVVNCDLGIVPAGSTVPVTIEILPTEATVPGSTPLSNSVMLTEVGAVPGTLYPDLIEANNSAVEETDVLPTSGSDLAVTKVDDPDPAIVDNSLTYTIGVTNNGPDDAPNVNVMDTLPILPSGTPPVTFVRALAGQGACSETDGVVNCPLGTVSAGDTVLVTIEVLPKIATVPGASPLLNSVVITEVGGLPGVSYPDLIPANNTAVAETVVLPSTANVSPTADAGPDQNVRTGRLVDLDGSNSYDPDNGPAPLTFLWSFVTVPVASSLTNTDLVGANTESPNFTPDVDGIYELNLEVSDSDLTENDQVSIIAGNTAPVAVDDPYSVDEDNTLTMVAPGVLGNDSDAEGDVLTANVVINVSNGTLTLETNGSFIYIPNTDFNGSDIFTYVANDGDLDSSEATVTITVNPVEDDPVALDDSYTVDEDNALTVLVPGVLGNDSDADGNSLTASVVVNVNDGTLTLNTDGSFDYTPNAGFNGTDSFTYVANDGSSDSNTATVTITVNAVNDPPIADAGPDQGARTGQLVTLNGSNSNDPDNGPAPLTFLWSFVSVPAGSSLTNIDLVGANTDSPNFTPDVDGTYELNLDVSDSDLTGSDQVNVIAGNSAPVAVDDSYSVDEDNTLTIVAPGVLGNDSDAEGDPLTAPNVVSSVSNGTLTLETNGSFIYIPNTDFNGTDIFTYVANDGDLDSSEATVTITVNPVEDDPVALDDSYTVDEDNALTVVAPGVLGNDSDADGNSLAASMVNNVSNGTLTLNGDGSFTYTPSLNLFGTDRFTYVANDGSSNSNTATVTITVNAVNDAPVAVDDSYTVDEDNILTVNAASGVLGNDTDVEGSPLTAGVVINVSNGTLTLNGDGSFTYTPSPNFFGTDSFTYSANDGGSDSNVATATITVNPVNDAPVAVDDPYTVDEDNTLNINAASGVLGNDNDVEGDPMTVSLAGAGVSNGLLTLNTDGSFDYTPNADFNGPDTFIYKSNDGDLDSNEATATITVNAVNDVPIAEAGQDQIVFSGDTVSLDGSGSSDIDGDPLTYSWTFISRPAGSSATISNPTTVNPTFLPDEVGLYEIQLIVNDGTIDSAADTVNVNIILCGAGTVNWLPDASGNWNEAGNWSGGSVPGPTDEVCIDVPSDITVTISTDVGSIVSLLSNEKIAIINGSLTVDNASTILQELTMNYGTFSGTGDLTVTGLFTFENSVMGGGDTATTFANGGILFNGSACTLSRVLEIPSGETASWTSGAINFTAGGIIDNNGTFSADNPGYAAMGGTGGVINNSGTFVKADLVGGTVGDTIIGGNIIFNNTGNVNVEAGKLQFAQYDNDRLTGSGDYSVAAGGTLLFGSTGTFGIDGDITGDGIVAFYYGTIDINGTYNITGSTQFGSSANVMFNPACTLTSLAGGSLYVAGGGVDFSSGESPINVTTFEFVYGTVTGPDSIIVSDLFTFTGGLMDGSGTTFANGGMLINGSTRTIGRTIEIPSGETASWPSGTINFTAGGIIDNNGTFSADNPGYAQMGGTGGVINNSGTFVKANLVGGTVGDTIIGGNIIFNNTDTGNVNVDAGKLQFAQSGDNRIAGDGNYSVGAGGTLLFGSTGTFGIDGDITGDGIVAFYYGTIDINGTYNITGSTQFGSTANVMFNPTCTLTSLAGDPLYVAGGGTVDFSSGETPINVAELDLSNGTVTGSDSIEVNGPFTWTGGTMAGSGITYANSGVELSGNNRTLDRTLELPSGETASWTGGNITFGTGGNFNNSGTFRAEHAGLLYMNGTGGSFNNSGSFIKADPLSGIVGSTYISGPDFSNSGTVDLEADTLRLTGTTYTQTAGSLTLNGGDLSSTTLIDIRGGSLSGTGTITGNVSNAGSIGPGFTPGQLDIAGSYTQEADGSLDIELAGTDTAGTDYDQLNVTGSATRAGDLNVTFIDNFTPALGNTFVIMTYGSQTGAFTNINLPSLTGLNWDIDVGATSTTLTVVP